MNKTIVTFGIPWIVLIVKHLGSNYFLYFLKILKYIRVRGGLSLQADFQHCAIDTEYESITKDFNEEELYINPIYDIILERIINSEESLDAFSEKIKVFVNLDWATSDVIFLYLILKLLNIKFFIKCIEQVSITNLKIIQSPSDNSLFYIILPEDRFDPELFSVGIHLDIKSYVDPKIKISVNFIMYVYFEKFVLYRL